MRNNHRKIIRAGAKTIYNIPINILCPRLNDFIDRKDISHINLTEVKEIKMEVIVFLKDGTNFRW